MSAFLHVDDTNELHVPLPREFFGHHHGDEEVCWRPKAVGRLHGRATDRCWIERTTSLDVQEKTPTLRCPHG